VPSPSIIHQITHDITSAPGKFIQITERFIRPLPPVVKHSFPYFLFLLLLVDILLMTLQIRRELRASRALQAILQREHQSGQLKKTFIELISHYLRTPLTVLSTSLELLASIEGRSSPVVTTLQTDVAELNNKVNTLVTQATDVKNVVEAGE
jgi:signal transduction histidine kinase